MKRLVFTLFTVFAATALCSAQNPNETRVVKDAAGRVKYTVHKTGNREIIKDSKGRITGTTRETKERKYYYNSNGSSAGTETKWEPASRQRKSHHTASPESNEVIGSGSAISIPKGCSDSGRHIPQRYGPDRKGAETKRGGNTPLFNHIVQPGLISLYRCGGRNPPPGAVLRPIPTAPDGRSETP